MDAKLLRQLFSTFKILALHAALFVVTLVEGQARKTTVRDQIELQI